jgi:hypothetical protein
MTITDMDYVLELVNWLWLMQRVKRDPARFLERAAFHLGPVRSAGEPDAGSLLMVAPHFVAQGKEPPSWLFKSARSKPTQ